MPALKRRNAWQRPPNVLYTRRCSRCDRLFYTKAKEGKVCGDCYTGYNCLSGPGFDFEELTD